MNLRSLALRHCASFLAGLIVLVSGCASVGPSDSADSKVEGSDGLIVVRDPVEVDSGLRADFARATALLEREQYREGIELLEKVIGRSPQSTAPYINLAIAYRQQDMLDEAERNLEKVLAIAPLHPAANNEYARILRHKGKFLEARQVYERVLKKYPDFHPARLNLGILCDIYLADFQCALENYRLYSKAKPDEEQVKLWLVDLERRQ